MGKTGKKGKIVILLAVLMAFGVVTGCSSGKPTAVVEEKYIPVEVEAAGMQTLVNTATVSGMISSDTDVSVIPEVAGKVMSVNVKVGDYVSQGAVLFRLDATDIEKQVGSMQASLQLAEASYQKNKEQWDTGKTSLERTQALANEKITDAKQNLANTKALYDAGAVAKVQLDQAELTLKELESSFASQLEQLEVQTSDSTLKMAEAQLNQAQVGYNQALETLDNAVVTAPVDGVVSQVNVTVGNMATSAQSALSLTNKNSLYTTISVAENLVNRLTQGNVVQVTVPTVSAGSFVGKIDNIGPSSDPKTHLYPVKILVANAEGLIKPGMFVKVQLTTEEKAGVMAIKSEAVVLKNDKTIVYVVDGDKAVAKEVVTGLDTGVDIEILKGLTQGDQVIIKGQTLVADGHKVKVVGGEES
ncbi:efflux RND transporter periplasmic adaptor subunit [Desulfosporosinus fructosivorans]|uniref:Efflux RND transporter periplasmic adaptor subunit n=2 Tax=Desulfosporosinus fructosivorans TaxID=2018669 RepID=A0A4Z0RDT8_9FIRM|nr:efflux RND transporter periplasmic adaptor subunit [Desulfosporosinus fructosivorans]